MKDRFSDNASGYATYRPRYPELLFKHIYSHINSFDVAWDAGTGNGQVAEVLAGKFNKVYATDISIKQLMKVPNMPNLSSFVADESAPQIPDSSVDLITVAQALHWFRVDKFCTEVTRIAKPGAVLAVWGYGLVQLPIPWQHHMSDFYTEKVGPFWDSERRHIDSGYTEIPIPFEELEVRGKFQIDAKWTQQHLIGYLNTWSAVGNYISEQGDNPVTSFTTYLVEKGLPKDFTVSFPVFIRLFRV